MANNGELLTRDQVSQIRTKLEKGIAPKTIAHEFGKHVNTIYHIRRNQKWEGYDA